MRSGKYQFGEGLFPAALRRLGAVCEAAGYQPPRLESNSEQNCDKQQRYSSQRVVDVERSICETVLEDTMRISVTSGV